MGNGTPDGRARLTLDRAYRQQRAPVPRHVRRTLLPGQHVIQAGGDVGVVIEAEHLGLGELAGQFLARVKEGGTFGCFPTQNPRNAALHPTIQINIVIAPVNSATILRYAEAVRDGKVTIPVERIMPLADAADLLPPLKARKYAENPATKAVASDSAMT